MNKKLLLHTCCAPCSIVIVDELKNKFDLMVFFYNPNIYPAEEYDKRKIEVFKVCEEWGVPMVDMDYDVEGWNKKVAKGLELAEEGGVRCSLCFRFRLAKSAEYAAKNGFDYFASSLTSGRNKKAEAIHPIAQELAKYYGVKFYDVDWKSGGRQEKGREMVKERGIYRQNYCGCQYSLSKKI